MAALSQLTVNFAQFIVEHGVPVKVQLHTGSFVDSDYDENQAVVTSGTLQAGSGFLLPVGKDEIPWIAQGRLSQRDKVLYLGSEFEINSTADITVGGGSYTIAAEGMKTWPLEGIAIYSKIYIREKI